MAVSDRWNRVTRRPHTETVTETDTNGEPATREVIVDGAFDPGLPIAVPVSRNTRQYRRTIARRQLEESPPGLVVSKPAFPGVRRTGDGTPVPQQASETIRRNRARTSGIPRQNQARSHGEPPATTNRTGANRSDTGSRGGTGDAIIPLSRTGEILDDIVKIYTARYCEWCGGDIPLEAPHKKKFCKDQCRKDSFKAGKRKDAQAKSESMTPGVRKYFSKDS
jgi:hypothetical protein